MNEEYRQALIQVLTGISTKLTRFTVSVEDLQNALALHNTVLAIHICTETKGVVVLDVVREAARVLLNKLKEKLPGESPA